MRAGDDRAADGGRRAANDLALDGGSLAILPSLDRSLRHRSGGDLRAAGGHGAGRRLVAGAGVCRRLGVLGHRHGFQRAMERLDGDPGSAAGAGAVFRLADAHRPMGNVGRFRGRRNRAARGGEQRQSFARLCPAVPGGGGEPFPLGAALGRSGRTVAASPAAGTAAGGGIFRAGGRRRRPVASLLAGCPGGGAGRRAVLHSLHAGAVAVLLLLLCRGRLYGERCEDTFPACDRPPCRSLGSAPRLLARAWRSFRCPECGCSPTPCRISSACRFSPARAWGANDLASLMLFFETIPREKRVGVLTVFNLASAAATVAGSLLGAVLLATLGAGRETYLALFALSTLARAAGLLLLARVPAAALMRQLGMLRAAVSPVSQPIPAAVSRQQHLQGPHWPRGAKPVKPVAGGSPDANPSRAGTA